MAIFDRILKRYQYYRKIQNINGVLANFPDILVSKARDFSEIGLKWYKFSYCDKERDMTTHGVGAGFSDHLGILRAWAEFLYRAT